MVRHLIVLMLASALIVPQQPFLISREGLPSCANIQNLYGRMALSVPAFMEGGDPIAGRDVAAVVRRMTEKEGVSLPASISGYPITVLPEHLKKLEHLFTESDPHRLSRKEISDVFGEARSQPAILLQKSLVSLLWLCDNSPNPGALKQQLQAAIFQNPFNAKGIRIGFADGKTTLGGAQSAWYLPRTLHGDEDEERPPMIVLDTQFWRSLIEADNLLLLWDTPAEFIRLKGLRWPEVVDLFIGQLLAERLWIHEVAHHDIEYSFWEGLFYWQNTDFLLSRLPGREKRLRWLHRRMMRREEQRIIDLERAVNRQTRIAYTENSINLLDFMLEYLRILNWSLYEAVSAPKRYRMLQAGGDALFLETYYPDYLGEGMAMTEAESSSVHSFHVPDLIADLEEALGRPIDNKDLSMGQPIQAERSIIAAYLLPLIEYAAQSSPVGAISMKSLYDPSEKIIEICISGRSKPPKSLIATLRKDRPAGVVRISDEFEVQLSRSTYTELPDFSDLVITTGEVKLLHAVETLSNRFFDVLNTNETDLDQARSSLKRALEETFPALAPQGHVSHTDYVALWDIFTKLSMVAQGLLNWPAPETTDQALDLFSRAFAQEATTLHAIFQRLNAGHFKRSGWEVTVGFKTVTPDSSGDGHNTNPHRPEKAAA